MTPLMLTLVTGASILAPTMADLRAGRYTDARLHIQEAARRDGVRIPFELVNKTIFLKITVKSKSLWFVLDTGNKYAVIDLATAESLGLEMGDQVAVGGGGKATVMGRLLKTSEFDVVGLQRFSQPLFIAVPLADLANASGHEFAGVLGFDFISQFVIDIDYLRRTLTLHDKSGYQYHGNGEILPITFNAAGFPQVRAQVVDGANPPIDGTFVLDIGSGAALILNKPFVEKEEFLTSGRPTVPWLEGRGFGGGIEGSVGRMTGLKLGRARINNPVTVFSRADSGPFAASDAEGNIGAAILEKFRVILDYTRSRIILEPNSNFGAPLEYNRSGLALVSLGNDYKRFKIEGIADNSPASEAGLRAGDLLVTINGRPAAEYTLSQIRSMFEDARQCDLIVRRGDHHMRMQLTLRRLI